jgi:hypothetical protein
MTWIRLYRTNDSRYSIGCGFLGERRGRLSAPDRPGGSWRQTSSNGNRSSRLVKSLVRVEVEGMSVYTSEDRVMFAVWGGRFRKDGLPGKRTEHFSIVLEND